MSRSYDPVRVAAPDGLVAEVDGVTGRRYKATGGGMYEMHPRDAKALIREGGFAPGVGLALGGGGYRCPGCGFAAVIRTCSRCGERCETAAERNARLVREAVAEDMAMHAATLSSVKIFEDPLAVATRPQDWAEPARSIIFRERA
jgi:hypothetical protein